MPQSPEPQHHHIMSPEDTARCQRAIDLANTGQKQRAYQQFCALYNRNASNITLLYWLASTTPSLVEAERALDTIDLLEPNHPNLPKLRNHLSNMQQRAAHAAMVGRVGPSLQCPYCHHVSPVRVTRKISVGGWVWFAAFFLIFFGFMSALAPIAEAYTMECTAFFFLLVGIVGLFVIKKRVYHCGQCGITFGDTAH
ncbi:MAG TPA: hypothetical protein VL485_11800 [Ktedonobacteraceae bacterium]|nr:hypothetical protein [Ktedonobacteraceae bacterium]